MGLVGPCIFLDARLSSYVLITTEPRKRSELGRRLDRLCELEQDVPLLPLGMPLYRKDDGHGVCLC